jgi:hypothetical protein
MKLHVMRRGSVYQRFVADRNCPWLRKRIVTWAADRRTGAPLLRRALDEVKTGEPRSEWDAFSLKVEYLEMMTEFDRERGYIQHVDDEDQKVQIAEGPLPLYLSWTPSARRYLLNEPERSRRVLRLAFANWLAHVADKDPRHLKPAVRATFPCKLRSANVSFFAVSADAAAAARQLTPQALAEWLISARDAKLLLSFWPWPSIRVKEQREHRELVMRLAFELYRRDHGKPATDNEELIGPYLDHLPDDGSNARDDGTVPTVRESKSANK